MQIKAILEFFRKLPKQFLSFIAILLVLAIGDLDFLIGSDGSLAVLYLFPVILIAWFEGGVPAIIISILGTVTWLIADLASGHIYSHEGIEIWNAIMVLALYLIGAYITILIKKFLKENAKKKA